MKCPFCRHPTTEVYNSRTTRFGAQTWRRRRCTTCHQTFTTYESTDLSFLHVTRPSGPHLPYSRARLYAALLAAFEPKQPPTTIESITDTIESKILDLQQRDVSTEQINRIVLSTLKHFDSAAFLRYLAGHSNFAITAKLERELKQYE